MTRFLQIAQRLFGAGLVTFGGSLFAAEINFDQQEMRLAATTEDLIVADLNGDGLQDLIAIVEGTLQIYFHTEDGFDFNNYETINFPGQAIGWDLSKQYSESGNTSIIALIDGREVLAWSFDGQTPLAPIVIKSNLNGFLSKGVNRLHFSRDINGDEIDDFLIPGAGAINLHISSGISSAREFEYQAPLSVRSELRMRTNLNEDSLERRTGQSVRIPMMELRDVNGDGFQDLVSRTEEELKVFIANNSAIAYFPTEASYSLDILEIEERLGEFDIDNLDFSNLTGLLALTHEEILEDVDGDGIDDLLLREGGKVSLFGGEPNGMNFTQPRQVLRSGGNVLSTFLYDENEDGLKDLWLWRVESISVGDIFVWLALSGSIAVEAFIYPNEGERFARRPSRKVSIDLKFPSVISLSSTFRDFEQEILEAGNGEEVFSNLANLDGDRSQQDLILMIGNQIRFFLNSIQLDNEPENETDLFLGAVNYSRQRDNYEFNIRDVIENISIAGTRHLDTVAGRTADSAIELSRPVVNGAVIPVTLNRDERQDVIIFTETDGSHIQGLLLLSD
ncbi:MAG: VCBS repeat-containing protein [Pseudohongiellaceae bacterium]